MLNFFKQQWPLLMVYLAMGQVLYFANIYVSDWAFWAIWVCFLVQAFLVQKLESSRYLDMIRKLNKHYAEFHQGFVKKQLESMPVIPPFSTPSAPAVTSQHGDKPHQP